MLGWIAIGVAAFMFIGIAAAVAIPLFLSSRGPTVASCQQTAPAGASPAAVSYIAALNSGYVGWTAVTRSLKSEHDRIYRHDLVTEYDTDLAFVAAMKEIAFTGPAAATAQQYETLLTAYAQLLDNVIDGQTTYVQQEFVPYDGTRGVLAAQLRSELDLPGARCETLKP